MGERDHPEIWLEPECETCAHIHKREEGRLWAQDDAFQPCEECGREATRYIIAPPRVGAAVACAASSKGGEDHHG